MAREAEEVAEVEVMVVDVDGQAVVVAAVAAAQTATALVVEETAEEETTALVTVAARTDAMLCIAHKLCTCIVGLLGSSHGSHSCTMADTPQTCSQWVRMERIWSSC